MPNKWTVLVYMAGDNNLEGAGRVDLAEMKKVGSSAGVQVAVQFDTRSGTTRYHVERGSLKSLGTFASTNTGSPKTLADFIRWGLKNYPADHVQLDVWNHGGGWENLPSNFDYSSVARGARPRRVAKFKRLSRSLFRTTAKKVLKQPIESRMIAIDSGSHDYLDNQELRSAIASGMGKGRKLDVLGMDACLMNMLEVAYELKDVVNFQVGSEQTEPDAGWPYSPILKQLTQKPGMAPADLAKLVVAQYRKSYVRGGLDTTQSALDLSKISAAATAVDALAGALIADLSKLAGQILLARGSALSFEDYPEYLDLADFTTQLDARISGNRALKAATARVRAALSPGSAGSFVIANGTTTSKMKAARGVSIYFPADRRSYSPDYKSLAFSKRNRWRTLLEKLFQL
jgi:Clostripain family